MEANEKPMILKKKDKTIMSILKKWRAYHVNTRGIEDVTEKLFQKLLGFTDEDMKVDLTKNNLQDYSGLFQQRLEMYRNDELKL